MTNEEILERQVEALEKLMQLKQAVIDELEIKVAKLQPQLSYPGISYWTQGQPSMQLDSNGNLIVTGVGGTQTTPVTYQAATSGVAATSSTTLTSLVK